MTVKGFPGGDIGREPAYQGRKPWFDPWVGRIPWRRAWQPTSGERSLAGPWCCRVETQLKRLSMYACRRKREVFRRPPTFWCQLIEEWNYHLL